MYFITKESAINPATNPKTNGILVVKTDVIFATISAKMPFTTVGVIS